MIRTLVLSTVWALLLSPVIALAAPLENLQQASVPVADQGAEARSEGAKKALGQVLARFTGQPAIAEDSRVQDLLEKPSEYVQTFGYEQGDNGELRLTARFDGRGLRKALVERGVRIWQAERPSVLAWVGVEGSSGRFIVGAEEGERVRRALRNAATDVGVPLLFPLLDLQDQQAVSFTDISGNFSEPILAASDRYGTSVVLIGRLRQQGSQWSGRWTLNGFGRGESWQASGSSLDAVARSAAHGLASRLRPDYAVLPSVDSRRELTMRVNAVDSLYGYQQAARILNNTPGVVAVRIDMITSGWVRFRLSLNVDPERVVRELDRNRRLERLPDWRPVTDSVGGEGQNAGATTVEPSRASSSDPTYRLIL